MKRAQTKNTMFGLKSKIFKQKTDTPLAGMDRDIAIADESLMLKMMGGFESFNPDKLVQKKGHHIYRKMLNDPQVKAAYNLRINIIISRNFRFETVNDDPVQDEIVEFYQKNIRHMKGTWIGAMRTVMLAKAYGYSVSEKLFDVGKFENKDKWFLKELKAKPYNTFDFITDKFGNLKHIVQKIDGSSKKLNPEKFIYMVNHPEYNSAYGDSELKAAYRAYWSKDILQKFWNIFLERMAGGFTVATPNERANSLSDPQLVNFKNVLKNLGMYSSVIAPLGYDIDVKQGNDTTAYQDALGWQNTEIAKAIMIPDLLGFSDRGKSGSRALGDTQLKTFMMTLNEDGVYLADTCNEQLWNQLAEWNFGIIDHPRMEFDPFTLDEAREIAVAWVDAVSKGAVQNTFDDEMRTRDLLNYPDREESDLAVAVPAEQEDKMPEDKKPVDEPGKVEELPKGKAKAEEKLTESEGTITDIIAEGLDTLSHPGIEKHYIQEQKFKEPQSFVARIDHKSLETSLDKIEDVFKEQLYTITDKVWSEIQQGVDKAVADLPKDRDKIDFVAITESVYNSFVTPGTKFKMNQIFKTNITDTYKLGRKEAQNTLKRTLKDAPKEIRDTIKLKLSLSPYMACSEDVPSVLHFVDGISLQQADKWIKQDSFQNTKDVTEDMLSEIQEILMGGIRDNKSNIEMINEMFDKLPGFLGKAETPEIRNRLETIIRTNMSSIFNQAQMSVYNDPQLGDFVEAFQYSSILDNRTTNFCEAYDDTTYPKADPIWGLITPPNHFNCRSVLIPVTVLDVWKESNRITSVQPSPGFGGIVTKEG